MNIDTATGLPELPEGYFWRINQEDVQIRRRLPDSSWQKRYYGRFGYLDLLDPDEERLEFREIDAEVTKSRQIGHWFWKKTVYEEVPAKTEQFRFVERSKKIVSAQTEKNGETTRKPGKSHTAEYRTRYSYYGYYAGRDMVSPSYTDPDTIIEHRHPVTKKNVLSICEKALEKFYALDLLGDYPPKKLEVEL